MSSKRILLADDSPTVRALLEETLLEEGYTVESACDGAEAIERIYRNVPDLVLLDIEMPRMNGYQALRLLREDPLMRGLPVIFLTSKAERSDRFWGLAVGADSYLVKDADSWMLLGKIKDLLEKHPDPPEAALHPVAEPPTQEALLERVNMLLDRKLFQSTLAAELGAIARDSRSMREAANQLFQLLGKVCDFHLAHIRLAEGDLMTCKAGALGVDFTSQADAEFRAVCERHGFSGASEERIDFEVSDVQLRTRGIPKSLGSSIVLDLQCRGETLGVLFVASGREGILTDPVRETLEVFRDGATLVLNAALTVRELERLRRRLDEVGDAIRSPAR